ncbi:hypothetical protein [Agrobacterium sp. NPDC089420]|uniref:hypothetical protein n=1 Tax=Agrobacterium sp. NPDC089420 TaxID=3363918 RepID=UPI00384F5F83
MILKANILSLKLISVAALALGIMAAPALASTATITLRNTNTGTPVAATIFNRTFQNTCALTTPTPQATFNPGDVQTFTSTCVTGTAGGLRYRTSTGKQCAFNWSSIPQLGGGYVFSATATPSGGAICRSIFGSRNLSTGDMSQTFEMQ